MNIVQVKIKIMKNKLRGNLSYFELVTGISL